MFCFVTLCYILTDMSIHNHIYYSAQSLSVFYGYFRTIILNVTVAYSKSLSLAAEHFCKKRYFQSYISIYFAEFPVWSRPCPRTLQITLFQCFYSHTVFKVYKKINFWNRLNFSIIAKFIIKICFTGFENAAICISLESVCRFESLEYIGSLMYRMNLLIQLFTIWSYFDWERSTGFLCIVTLSEKYSWVCSKTLFV